MKIFITGSAGFIGFHLSKLLLDKGYKVYGYDGMTDYYDVSLKKKRHEILEKYDNFFSEIGMLENFIALEKSIKTFNPEIIIHLAAQAGVRYSLENPRAYIESNIVGTFNVMEIARDIKVDHLLMASTSSVYGANENMPFFEVDKADTPLTIYAASKKATESMGHSYSHIYNLPITMFRFFTVYGPWGRPDMALFKFTKGIIDGTTIDVYNNGKMYRDFTYVDDLVKGISGLINKVPDHNNNKISGDTLSNVAPFRVVNIGNSNKVALMDFIKSIEKEVGKKASINYMPMQLGDVPATWADSSLLSKITGYKPNTNFNEGVGNFVAWYREYYKV